MDYRNKKVLVIGLARSGKAAIRVLAKLGAIIFLSEKKQINEEDRAFLEGLNVEIMGQEMEVFEKDYDLVIKTRVSRLFPRS